MTLVQISSSSCSIFILNILLGEVGYLGRIACFVLPSYLGQSLDASNKEVSCKKIIMFG